MPDHDREALLPLSNNSLKKAPQEDSSTCFKAYIICTMIFLWSGYTLMVRYTRSTVSSNLLYSSSTVVLVAEIVKLFITLVMYCRETNYHFREFQMKLKTYYFGAPKEILKMSVPSFAYALQNNLDFIGLSNLDAGVYQVTAQLKVVTTALFMMAFLGRTFSSRRWLAIFMLFLGVAAVQLNSVSSENQNNNENYVLGISAVLMTCVTAGFAGVYFEKMLKDGGSTPFWIRNMQMYSCGVISACLGCLAEADKISEKGFFFGYNAHVISIVGFLSIGGLYISLVMKHLDNLYKSFASAISIIIVVALSFILFNGYSIGVFFVVGTILVIAAILLYNSVNE
ncbi:unnamed protein product [Auanema sp. JU1783]|nr:unnamed protein product [Auanema sp. JU1783]